MSNTLYIKFLMRRLIKCLEKKQQKEAKELIQKIMEELDTLTLAGSFEYQACDDAICYLPVSIPITFTLELEHLDYQRANQR